MDSVDRFLIGGFVLFGMLIIACVIDTSQKREHEYRMAKIGYCHVGQVWTPCQGR